LSKITHAHLASSIQQELNVSVSVLTILSAVAVIGLAACGSTPVAPAEEAPLQPAAVCPSSFEDATGPAGKVKSP
jgi:hypothetical protein